MSHRITDEMTRWIEETVEQACPGERVFWDVFPTPSPQGLVHQVVVWYPSAAEIGAHNYMGLAVANVAAPNAEQSLRAGVLDLIEQLRQRRSQELAEANGHGPVPPGNAGGLIFPGGGL